MFQHHSHSEGDFEMDKKGKVGGDDEEMIIMENNKRERDNVVISIEQMLMELPLINPQSFMYKVPKLHYKVNETAYTPQLISIGPFHHGQPQLMTAQQYKSFELSKPIFLV